MKRVIASLVGPTEYRHQAHFRVILACGDVHDQLVIRECNRIPFDPSFVQAASLSNW